MLSIETLIFLLTSLLALITTYFSFSSPLVHQILAILILIMLIFINQKLPFLPTKPINIRWYKLLLLATSSLFVQLLVLSTGGFYSMFLIMLYLYTLGTSLMLNLRSSISFLIFSVLMLIVNILINPSVRVLFIQDPWSPIVYLISFLITIPLTEILIRTYHLHEVLAKSLTTYVKISEEREQSILAGLSELVIVTDQNLTILSLNEAAQRNLGKGTNEVQNKPLLTILPLKDKQGNLVTRQSLAIDKALLQKTTQVVEGFYLPTTGGTHQIQVTMRLIPVVDLQGAISQFAFIFKSTTLNEEADFHSYLEEARTRHTSLSQRLNNFPELQEEIELYGKVEDDKLTALVVENHPITPSVTRQDVEMICKRVMQAKQHFAHTQHAEVAFSIQFDRAIGLQQSSFFAPVDAKWLDLLLRKLLDIAILLASSEKEPIISFTLQHQEHGIQIIVAAPSPLLTPEDRALLTTQNYGTLGAKTNLQHGSGLEGFLAKTIATELKMPLTITYENNKLIETVTLSLTA